MVDKYKQMFLIFIRDILKILIFHTYILGQK